MNYTYFRYPVKIRRSACDSRQTGFGYQVDPTGFEPVISSVQGRRLPARLRARMDCWKLDTGCWNQLLASSFQYADGGI